jgi:3-hydroxy-9,10-secoandrosta-1,3,5(10)-triene-9,17-dione monooxygenase
MSPAWIYGVVGLHPWLVALLDDRAAQDIWGDDPTTLICSSLAPGGTAQPVDGGFRLSGRWRFSSGCEYCDWCVLGAQLPPAAEGSGERILLFLPKCDYRIVDTWRVSGLSGTGSHDIDVDDAFVPAYRTQSMLDNFHCRGPGQKVNTAPLYRLPFGQLFVRGVSTAAIGSLRGMLHAVTDYSKRRVTRVGDKAAEELATQLACAEAAEAIDELTATLHRTLRALEAYAERGQTPPLLLRLQYKYQSAAVMERCSLLAARLFRLTGGSGIYDDHPFGRMLADFNAGRQHNANQYDTVARNWGAALLGLTPRQDLAI